MLLSIPGNSLSTLLYPEVLKSRLDPHKMKEVLLLGVGKMYGLLIPIAVLTMGLSPVGIWILHGPDYLFVAVIIAIKTVSLVINLPLSTAYTSVMNTLNKPSKVTHLVMLNSVVNLTLIGPMMYWWGIWGALIAPFLIEILGFWIMQKGLRSEIHFRLSAIPKQIGFYWQYWYQQYNIKQLITSKSKTAC